MRRHDCEPTSGARRTFVAAVLSWALLAWALLAWALLAPAAAAAQEPQRRLRIIRTDSIGDSTVTSILVNPEAIERMVRELTASKAMEQTVGQSLRIAAGQGGDPKKLRVLSDELGRIAQKNASLLTSIQIRCSGDRRPDGYLGLQFSELQTALSNDPAPAQPLREYPKVDSVYPGSPASRAGVHRGDLVLRMGGVDARLPVQLDRLLRPSASLAMRVQRDGADKELTIVVGRRPADFNDGCANADEVMGPEIAPPAVFLRTPRAPGQESPPPVTFRGQVQPGAGSGTFVFGVTSAGSAIAGATLMALDDDWRATLGVDNGVLVTRVLPGTPSKDSGLRAGDVITTADGQDVSSVRALARIVSNANAKSVKLQVIRAGKSQTLVLSWQERRPDE